MSGSGKAGQSKRGQWRCRFRRRVLRAVRLMPIGLGLALSLNLCLNVLWAQPSKPDKALERQAAATRIKRLKDSDRWRHDFRVKALQTKEAAYLLAPLSQEVEIIKTAERIVWKTAGAEWVLARGNDGKWQLQPSPGRSSAGMPQQTAAAQFAFDVIAALVNQDWQVIESLFTVDELSFPSHPEGEWVLQLVPKPAGNAPVGKGSFKFLLHFDGSDRLLRLDMLGEREKTRLAFGPFVALDEGTGNGMQGSAGGRDGARVGGRKPMERPR